MKTKIITKGDIYLSLILLLIGFIFCSFIFLKGMKNASLATVEVNGTNYGSYLLNEDIVIRIQPDKTNSSYNIIQIKNGTVLMKEASCPDKYCVHHKPINKIGQTIVCLPNKLIVTVDKDKESQIDAITN